ncbi:MAG: hypothetical protein VX278_21295, partial [Myxococcota bacterium]|nr:hypothetical protein [Myxococcota bacterium]
MPAEDTEREMVAENNKASEEASESVVSEVMSKEPSEDSSEDIDTAELGVPTEVLPEPEEEPIDQEVSQAKALKKIASYIGWNVSIKKILYSGLERFENALYKQFLLHKDSQKLIYGYRILDKTDVKFSPPYKGTRIARKLAQLRAQEHDLSEENYLKGLQRLSKKLDVPLSDDLKNETNKDVLLEKFYFRFSYRNISKLAEKYQWSDYDIPNDTLSDRQLFNTVKELLLFEMRSYIKDEIKHLAATHSFQVPKSDEILQNTDLASLIVENEKLQEQRSLGQKLLNGQKLLSNDELEKLGNPTFPLKSEKVEEYLGTIHHRLAMITEEKRKKESIYRLVRIGLTSVLTVWIGLWEIQLFSDIQSLQLRGAEI